MIFRLGLRAKLLFFSAFLFCIPYLGYQYVGELETYLRIGQEQTMVGTARAVATALHERPVIFTEQSALVNTVKPGTDLYAHPIKYPIQLDGQLTDWGDYQAQFMHYGQAHIIEQQPGQDYDPTSLRFTHMVGQYGRYLYVVFDVLDDEVIFRDENALRIDRNDFLQIAMINATGQFQRYVVAPYQSGWVNAYLLDNSEETFVPLKLETRIQGQWLQSSNGYHIEMRIPLNMLASNIAFAITDVDDRITRQHELTIGTANPMQSDALGTVLIPSPEIEQILQGLQYANARVWVVDKHKRVLARSGDIQSAQGLDVTDKYDNANSRFSTVASSTKEESSHILSRIVTHIESNWLLPLYYTILSKPPSSFVDDLADAYQLVGSDIDKALTGKPETLWRVSSDKQAVILSAAHPIFVAGEVMGAVVVEQTTNGIRTLRNRALEEQFHFFLSVLVLGTLALFIFASRISSRVRRLRNDTEQAIDAQGKIIGSIPKQTAGDEIGDLGRSFAQVLDRLAQYNHYLENMASRLSHELRTPVAIVNSSLENLAISNTTNHHDNVFIHRAQDGIKRLSLILNNMSEATRLEHTLKSSEPEPVNVVSLCDNVLENMRMTSQRHFVLDNQIDSDTTLQGAPELFAQMLDKVLSNAVDFAHADSDIRLALTQQTNTLSLSITNTGPLLPEGMQSQLKESMVSVRNNDDQQVHLGLGLYIANMLALYHGGQMRIDNTPENDGVVVTFIFSL